MDTQKIQFDYYYGLKASQFAFYRIPKLLIKDKRFSKLSSDAKILYGLMLERMSLSMQNKWMDQYNRAYIIYTIENIMEDLGRSKPTSIKILKELDSENGIGLIEKKKRGLGKPDIIYVKDFTTLPLEPNQKMLNNDQVKEPSSDKVENFTSRGKKFLPQQEQNFNFQKKTSFSSGAQKNLPVEEKNIDSNYPDMSYPELNYPESIHLSDHKPDKMDGMDDTTAYMQLIKENIDYDYFMQTKSKSQKDLVNEIYDIMVDVICVKRKTIPINGENYPYEMVKSRYLKLNCSHIEYVLDCLENQTTKIRNIHAYILTTLYNAPSTANLYYNQRVRHDMYGTD